jgi:hypothetical protein
MRYGGHLWKVSRRNLGRDRMQAEQSNYNTDGCQMDGLWEKERKREREAE